MQHFAWVKTEADLVVVQLEMFLYAIILVAWKDTYVIIYDSDVVQVQSG